ncbi:glycosyltransferase [Streptosporangium sp. NPDC051023]|uniref:glycosyltransferase n=1 Tax=Streptosporangium sp. NPDC051023 TaxID=3155410 RepID=UPI00344E579A
MNREPDTRPPALGCHIGFEGSPAALSRLCEEIDATWTDLDVVPADHVIAAAERAEENGKERAGENGKRAQERGKEQREDFFLLARTPADLRRAVPYGGMLPRAHALTVIVADSPPWRMAPVPVPDGAPFWRTLRDIRVRRGERRARDSGRPPAYSWRVDVTFGRPAPAGDVLRALARGLGGLPRETLHTPVVSLAGVGTGHWRPGDPNATPAPVSGPVPARRDAPGCDLSLRTAGPDAPVWQAETAPLVDRPEPGDPAPGRFGPDHLAPIDERSVCPIGFLPTADGPVAQLVERSGAPEVVGEDVVVRLPVSGSLTDVDVARLRGLAGVAVDLGAAWSVPLGVARAVCGLAAAGVPVVAEPGAAWRDLLGGELAALLDGFAAERLSDALVREQYSIRLRRCALDLHGVAGRWRRIAAASGLRPRAPQTVSVLLCTRRPDMVGFALEQVGRQRGPEVEVILTLHGFPADHPDAAAALSAYRGAITVIEADSRLVFGDALNQAAERASGAYLTKMDDDDWYGPDHLSDLLLAQRYSSADLVGSAPEFVYLERIGVTVRRDLATETYTGIVAGGTMLMSRAAFDNAGGFRPIPRTVDGQLLQSVAAAGGRVYRTHGFNYILRRREASGHTWQEPINAFLRSFRRQWRGLHANPLMEMEGLSATGERDEA